MDMETTEVDMEKESTMETSEIKSKRVITAVIRCRPAAVVTTSPVAVHGLGRAKSSALLHPLDITINNVAPTLNRSNSNCSLSSVFSVDDIGSPIRMRKNSIGGLLVSADQNVVSNSSPTRMRKSSTNGISPTASPRSSSTKNLHFPEYERVRKNSLGGVSSTPNSRPELDVANKKIGFGSNVYEFDGVLGTECGQNEVFEYALPLVSGFMNYQSGVILVYGQTSSGKTFTMFGDKASNSASVAKSPTFSEVNGGVVSDALEVLFSKSSNTEYKISCLEIYNEVVSDLLIFKNSIQPSSKGIKFSGASPGNLKSADNSGLDVRVCPRGGFFAPELSIVTVKSKSEAMEMIDYAISKRSTSKTDYNRFSSRSHVILTFYHTTDSTAQLNFVDLAGSERCSSDHSDVQIREANYINKSLVTLGIVVASLGKVENTHINFRDSKLTKLLMASFMDYSSNLLIIGCISPDAECGEETTGTLRFVGRTKLIVPRPRGFDSQSKDLALQALREEVVYLRNIIQIPAILKIVQVHIPAIEDYLSVDRTLKSPLSILRAKSLSVPITNIVPFDSGTESKVKLPLLDSIAHEDVSLNLPALIPIGVTEILPDVCSLKRNNTKTVVLKSDVAIQTEQKLRTLKAPQESVNTCLLC